MYTNHNYKTKKALKESVAKGEKNGIFQPGGMFSPKEATVLYTGKASVEGPHYPAPHTWYAEVEMKHGIVVRVK